LEFFYEILNSFKLKNFKGGVIGEPWFPIKIILQYIKKSIVKKKIEKKIKDKYKSI
jgi:hypothetical protein